MNFSDVVVDLYNRIFMTILDLKPLNRFEGVSKRGEKLRINIALKRNIVIVTNRFKKIAKRGKSLQ